jgi:hypothetical protein
LASQWQKKLEIIGFGVEGVTGDTGSPRLAWNSLCSPGWILPCLLSADIVEIAFIVIRFLVKGEI